MSWSHSLVSQLSDKWQEDEPFLDFLKNTCVGISSLVDFHVFESLHEFFDFIFHFEWLSLFPSISHVASEGLLASANMIPKHFHVTDFVLNSVDLFVAVVDQLGVSELLSGVTKVANLDVQIVDFCVDGV